MRAIIALLIFILMTGCTQYKKIVYLQEEDINEQKVAALESYLLRPGDMLHVKLYSPDQNVNSMFNLEGNDNRSNYNDISIYLTGFLIDDNNRIELPIIGEIDLKGSTLASAKEIITDSVSNYIREATVNVKLLSYQVTVFGEVGAPGVKSIYRSQSTIFDVLSSSGDISTLGDRTDVVVLRKSGDVQQKLHIDLTDMASLGNPAYNIYPNDVIYVKPLKAKIFRDNIPIISLTLTTLTTFLLILNYIR
jgi:polysaccharide export outer membrane protein